MLKPNKTPIIQGVSASGKSFVVKLFTKLMGQKVNLFIYQLNSNSGISLFTGQSIIKKKFDKEEKEKLKKILKLLGEREDKNLEDIDFSLIQQKIKDNLNSARRKRLSKC